MRSRASRRGAIGGTTAIVAALLGLLALGTAGASADPLVSAVNQSSASVRAYWTKGRMQNAQPAPVLESGSLDQAAAPTQSSAKTSGKATAVSNPASFPNRTNGKVFMTIPDGIDQGDYECSGTAVQASNRSLVWTAGHCGFDSPEDPFPLSRFDCDCFVTNFEFVPGYNNGAKPYGEWPAASIATTSQWHDSGDSAYDFSAVRVKPRNRKRLQDVVGGRRLGFGQPRDVHYNAFGYPSEAPFDGERQYKCASGYEGADNSVGPPYPIRISCDMTPGSSGGGWVIKRRHRHHFRHYVVSLTSYGYDTEPDFLYGPYQGGVAKSLYQAAGR
jgi:hypothetical protein